jgi:hypothetical protein
MRSSIAAFLLLSLGTSWLAAQSERLDFVRDPNLAPGADNSERNDEGYSKLSHELEGGSFDPAASELLRATTNFTKGAFRLPSLRLESAITKRTDEEGDLIFVKWSFSEAIGAGSVVLKDSPYYFLYSFHVTRSRLSSENELDAFLRSLVAWGGKPVYFTTEAKSVRIPSAGGVSPFYLSIPGSQSPYAAGFSIDGISYEHDTFLSIFMGKQIAGDIYPTKWIPERFPPLSELVRNWTLSQIQNEIGKGRRGFPSEERDRVLFREIVRRGVDQEQLLDMLKEGKFNWLFEELREAGHTDLVASSFKTMVDLYRRKLILAGPVEFAVFMLRSSCAVPDEGDVTLLVRDDILRFGGLVYLHDCGKSRETLDDLKEVDVPETFATQKAATIAAIGDRLPKLP